MTPAAAADQSIEGSSRWLTQTKNSQRADARSKASEEARDRSQPEYFRVRGQQGGERLQEGLVCGSNGGLGWLRSVIGGCLRTGA
jgi:hypothetical protein